MIDPRLLLQGQVAQAGTAINQGLINGELIRQAPMRDNALLQQNEAQRIQNEQSPIRSQYLQGQVDAQTQALNEAQNNQQLVQDAQTSIKALGLIEANRFDGLEMLAQQELQTARTPLERQEAQEVLEMASRAKAGDTEAAQLLLGEFQRGVRQAQQMGVLSSPSTQDNKGRFKVVDETGAVIDSATGSITIDPQLKAAVTANAQKLNEKEVLKPSDIRGINSDIRSITKGANDIRKSAVDLESLRKLDSPAAQLATIFKFMKALDPTSVVREGEQDQLARTGGIFDYFSNVIEGIRSGQKLTASQLAEIEKTGKTLANNAIDSSNGEIENYLTTFDDSLTNRQRENFSKFKLDGFEIESTQPEESPQFEVGKIYTDANGNKARYTGNGWEEL